MNENLWWFWTDFMGHTNFFQIFIIFLKKMEDISYEKT